MRSLFIVFCAFVFLSACDSSPEFELDRDKVQALVDSAELAIQSKNADALVALFTEDAVITMDMPSDIGGKEIWNLKQYREMLEKGWAMPFKSTHEMKDLTISIQNSKNAFVMGTVVEEISMNGNVVMSSQTKEEIAVVVEGGQAKIKSILAKISM